MGVCAEYINEKTGMKVISSSLDLTPEEEKKKRRPRVSGWRWTSKERESR